MKLLLRIFPFLAFTFGSTAFSQTLSIWNNTGTNPSFEAPTNWNNGAPGSTTISYVVPGGVADPNGGFFVTPGGDTNIVITSGTNATSEGLDVTNDIGSTLVTGTVNLTFAQGTALTVTGSLGVTGGQTLIYTGNLSVENSVFVGGDGTGTFTLNGTLNNSQGFFEIGSGTGNSGVFNQNGSSVVDAGFSVDIGAGGSGSYTLNSTSILETSSLDDTIITVGSNSTGETGSSGTLTLLGGSKLILNPGTDLQIGTSSGLVPGGTGVVNQTGNGTTVSLNGSATMEIGDTAGSSGTYNLQGGTLNIGATSTDTASVDLGVAANSSGTLNQSGGTLIALAGTTFTIGDAGAGLYTLSGGTADFQNGLTLGAQLKGNGSIVQTGGTLTVENNPVDIGVVGTGSFEIKGGSATFNDGIVVGSTGSVNQMGGTVNIAGGTLDLSAVGSSYTLGGGLLQIDNTAIIGTSGQGTFNFGGGTLQITSAGTFNENLDGTLTGNSTIDAATTPGITAVTMAGNLDGSGGLTFEGSAGTVFSFSGINSYTGTTSIVSGTLNASAADVEDSAALNIGSAGTLNLTLASGGLAYGGTLEGAGLFSLTFGATGDALVLANSKGFAGNIVLGGSVGTLQVYGGTFNSIGGNGSGVTIGGTPLLPLGGTPKTGAVTINSATYTGTTTVSSGFTLYGNAFNGAVNNNGTFYGTGSGALTNAGTMGLAKNSAVGTTFNVNGDFTSNAGSTILIRATGLGATPVADGIFASGNATVDPDTTIKVTGSGNITTPIPIIVGDTGLTAATLPILSTGLLFQATLTLDTATNSIDLTAVQNPLALYAITPNEAATAVPIDQAILNANNLTPGQQKALNHLLDPLNNLKTAAQIAQALEQLSPESLQYSREIAFENSTFLVQKMNGVDANLRGGYGGLDTSAISVVSPVFNSGLGHSLQSFIASDSPSFHQTAPNGVNYYPGGDEGTSETITPSGSSAPPASHGWNSSSQVITDSPNPYLARQNPSGPETPGFSEFISGDAILADLNQNQNTSNAPSSSASYTAASATAGVSFRMTSHLAAGVLIDYTHTDADTDSSGSKTSVDSYSPGLFATYFDHGFYVNGLATFGYDTYSNSRNIGLLGETATSNPDGQQYVGDLDFGYDFHPDKNWVVGPTLGVTYTHLDIDSFHETGAPGADLTVNDQSADSLRTRLGGHVVFQTNTGDVLLQPSLIAMWQHEFLDNSSGITSTFSDFSSTPFTINTAGPTRDSALVGIGLDATLSTSMTLYLNYFADIGFNDYLAQNVVAGLKARF